MENGADVNAKTGKNGGTALYYARKEFEDDHPIIDFLEGLGAIEDGPDL